MAKVPSGRRVVGAYFDSESVAALDRVARQTRLSRSAVLRALVAGVPMSALRAAGHPDTPEAAR